MIVRGRIDQVTGVEDDGLTAWLTTVGTDLVLVHHILPQREGIKWETQKPVEDTTNPHYHFCLNTSYKSVQALAYQLKKRFTNLGKADWSIKPCDPARRGEYLQYLFNNKHGNKWRLVKAFTEMDQYINQAAAVTADFAARRKEKQKQHSGYDISMELAQWCKTMGYAQNDSNEHYQLIVKHAIELHRLYKKSFCQFSLERIVYTALGETQPDLLATAVATKISTTLFRKYYDA